MARRSLNSISEQFSYKTLLLVVVFLLIPIVLLWRINHQPKVAFAEWWNDAWSYRKAVTLSNSGVGQTQVYLTLAIGTSDTSRFQSDCGDIRFTDQSGSLLNYYIVSGCGTTNTQIHVNFPTLPAGTSTVYLYYGNPSINNGFSVTDFSTAAASTAPPDTPATEEVGGGPVAWWKFDEGVGTSAFDSSSSKINGLLSNVQWVPENQCISGSCLYFNGTNAHVNLPSLPSNIKTTYTVSMWVKPQKINAQQSLLSFNGTGTYPRFELLPNNRFLSYCGIEKYRYGSKTLSSSDLDQWYLLTFVVVDGTSLTSWKVYLNGQDISGAIGANTGTYYEPSTYGSIGSNKNFDYFQGYLDDIKIYPYARTSSQILQDYSTGLSGQSSSKGNTVALGGQNSTTLTNSLIGYWKFDEGSGITANNSGNAGPAINGTLSGATLPTWTTGKANQSLSFNGSTSWVDAGNSSIYNITQQITLSAWVFPNSFTGAYRRIIDKGYGAQYHLSFGNTDPTTYIYCSLNISGTLRSITSNSTVTTNQWSHLACTYDGDKIRVYVNGQLKRTSPSYPGTINTSSNKLAIGSNPSGGENMNGLIDEVKIYNIALSDEEIKLDYNQGAAAVFGSSNQTIGGTTTSLEYCLPGDTSPCSPPITEYKFEEGIGTSIVDTSGNGYSGTWNGTGSHYQPGKFGKAASFNGSNDYLSIPDSSSLRPGTGDYTVGLWIKFPITSTGEASGWGSILTKGLTTSAPAHTWGFVRQAVTTNAVNFQQSSDTGGSYDVNLGTSALSNGWHYLTARRSGTTTQLYVDGNFISQDTSASSDLSSTSNLMMGRNNRSYTQMSADQVRIYNYARTPSQIAYDYNKGGPILWWKMDECQGTVLNDSSGNGLNGSISIPATGTQNSLGTCQVGTSAAWTNGASGKFGGSLNLDGTDDYADTASAPLSSSGSLSVWIKPPASMVAPANYPSLISYAGDPGIYIQQTSGKPYLQALSTAAVSSVPLIADQWQLLTATFFPSGTNTALRLYLNGSLVASGTGTGLITPANNIFGITRSQKYQGQIDDIRLYNYPLTQEQIKQLYNGGAINFR